MTSRDVPGPPRARNLEEALNQLDLAQETLEGLDDRSAQARPRRSRAIPGKGTTDTLMKRAYELTFIVRLDGTDEATDQQHH